MNKIRNFCIIAHIDHGKSTLADRMMEITGTVEKRLMKEQLLDQMDLERERGITIKLQPVRMIYHDYILNLIDTPGHIDFSYEVSRSLAAVEGAILLVDATQGIQAQTLSTLHQALHEKLRIIPVINKIDLPAANTANCQKEIANLLNCQTEDILLVSAKTGQGVTEVLDQVIKKIPAPSGSQSSTTRCLIFDSKYDPFRGVIANIRVIDGQLMKGDSFVLLGTRAQEKVVEIGYFLPNMTPCDQLSAGEIGYVVTGSKDIKQIRVGDTIATCSDDNTKPLPGYKQILPNVFSSIFTVNSHKYSQLRDALEKLKLNDASLIFEPEKSQALGFGFRCGFLGLLHLEIIKERLEREFDLDLITTTPSVAYQITKTNDQVLEIYSASELPDPSEIKSVREPIAKVEIILPNRYLGNVMSIVNWHRGVIQSIQYLESDRLLLQITMPLSELIIDFFDQLKSASSGFASMSYSQAGFQESDLVKIDILVANQEIKPLARIVPKNKAFLIGKELVEKLKATLPKQNFAVPIQAAVGGRVIARETLSAFRKDVIEKIYGGDVTRKQKLLNKQKKGKKRMAKFGRVEIPSEVFLKLLRD